MAQLWLTTLHPCGKCQVCTQQTLSLAVMAELTLAMHAGSWHVWHVQCNLPFYPYPLTKWSVCVPEASKPLKGCINV